MANTIALAKEYKAVLDEIYTLSAKTRILDNMKLIQEGTQANEVLIPKITLQGLGDYSKSTGFVSGDVTLAWETHKLNYDRGREFQVDNMDNLESMDQAFGMLTGDFVRTQVVPEIDAIRIAKLCSKAANTATGATLTKSTVAPAIQLATKLMNDAEVPLENRVLFVTPEVLMFIQQSDMFVRNVDTKTSGGIDTRVDMFDGVPVVMVPQTRMYTALTMYDGTTTGQEAGSYIKNASTGKDVNFILVHAPSVMGIVKHVTPRIFDPAQNQTADAWKFQYRVYHDLLVPDNKTNGIYVHPKA